MTTTSQLNAFRAAVEATVLTAWTTTLGYPATSIAWGEIDFEPTPQMTIWLQSWILYGETRALTAGIVGTGTGSNQTAGLVHLNVFGRPGFGTGTVIAACDALRDAFNRQVIGGAQFYGASGPVVVTVQGQPWYQRVVKAASTRGNGVRATTHVVACTAVRDYH